VRDQAGNAFDPEAPGEQHAEVDGGLMLVLAFILCLCDMSGFAALAIFIYGLDNT
jgi:membrane-bound ClpP family serine protease